MHPRFYLLIAALAVIVVALAVVLLTSGGGKDDAVQVMSTPEPAATSAAPSNATMGTVSSPGGATDAEVAADGAQEAAAATDSGASAYSSLAAQLDDEDSNLVALDESERVKVSDLSVNTSLPDNWTNILLLGTDERIKNESARTDTMIICSISDEGEVKLTSIMRDVAVEFDDLGDMNGTYRINSANFFGGPEYAMKTINECFGMNIQYYATVNFFGFQKIVEALGGIEVDITEAERDEINRKQLEQYRIANAIGEEAPTLEEDFLNDFGANTHLNGHQTLAYARVRKSDSSDSDFTRAQRQRTVLVKLMEKLRGRSAMEILALVSGLSEYVTFNMDVNFVAETAYKVLSSGFADVDTLRLPVNGSYKEEERNERAMLYDCDWAANSLELYNFIYE